MFRSLTAALLIATATPTLAQNRVIFFMDKDTNSYTHDFIQKMENAAKKTDAFKLETVNAQSDSKLQIKQVQEALAAKPSALIVRMVDDKSGEAIAELAQAAAVPIVFVNKRPSVRKPSDRTVFVSSNDLVAGRLQMRMLAETIGYKGRVAILRGDDTNRSLLQRVTGMEEIIAAHPQLTLVENASARWSRAEAQQIVSGWLKSGKTFDAIAACNDDMALGAIAALKEAGLAGKIAVGGIDGSKDGMAAIKAGEMTASILQNTAALTTGSVAAAARIAKGEYNQQYDWVSFELIVASNLARYDR